jgi:hypothetical protein
MTTLMGHTKLARAAVTTGTAAYATGDVIGGTVSFTGLNYVNTSGVIVGANVVTMSGGSLPLTLTFFKASPTTNNDNAAGTFATTDLTTNLVGQMSVATTDYVLMGSAGTPPCAAYVSPEPIPFETSPTGTLYCVPIARGAFTFTGTSDLHITLAILQD